MILFYIILYQTTYYIKLLFNLFYTWRTLLVSTLPLVPPISTWRKGERKGDQYGVWRKKRDQ